MPCVQEPRVPSADYSLVVVGAKEAINNLKEGITHMENIAGSVAAEGVTIQHHDIDVDAPTNGKEKFNEVIDMDDAGAMTFPQRLMEILDNEDYSSMISWLPHGGGFVVFRKKAFALKILPKHFNKQSKFSSFTRKLNRWGFQRVTRGHESGAYCHPLFMRGGHRLCVHMSCQSSIKGAAKTAVVAPDFSALGPAVIPTVANTITSKPHILASPLQQATLLQSHQLHQIQLQQLVEQELLRRAAIRNSQEIMLMQGAGVDFGGTLRNPGIHGRIDPTILDQLTRLQGRGGGADIDALDVSLLWNNHMFR